MPELPEVETICRGIRPQILNRTITAFYHSGKNLRSPLPYDEIARRIVGQEIVDVRRRAKYLIIEAADGCLLIIHLGMTGNLGIFSPETVPAKHCHIRFSLSDEMELRYTDIRRFGSVHVIRAEEVPAIESTFFRTTGPEPFDAVFNGKYLYQLSRNKTIPIKTFIMTNQVVSGIGNIYANESLFKAGIGPKRKVHRISEKRLGKLVKCIQEVLLHAIECGGSTISDYVNADQESGYFQMNFKVYGRTGELCKKCGDTIRKEPIGGRASYYCPTCQR